MRSLTRKGHGTELQWIRNGVLLVGEWASGWVGEVVGWLVGWW